MLNNSFKKEKTCRACTKTDLALSSLFDKQSVPSGLCYSDMITECTMYRVDNDDELPRLICFECIDKVRIAYDFKKQFEESQRKLLTLIESIKQIETEPVEAIYYSSSDQFQIANDVVEIESQRRKSTRNASSKRNDLGDQHDQSLSSSKEDQLDNQDHTQSDGKPRRTKCPTCSKEFVRLGHLRNHIKKIHKTEDETPEITTSVEKFIVKCESSEFVVETLNELSESELMIESDADDDQCEFLIENDEDAINCPDTESVKSFKGELDISDSNIILPELPEATESGNENEELIAEKKLPEETESTNENEEEQTAKQDNTKKPRQKKSFPERRFQCEICNKSFKRNSHLKQHLLCHTKLKLYECTICQKRFGRADNLKVHMSNHGKRQFECDTCQRTFGQAYLLKRHKEQTHSEEKPFLCSECGQRFVRNGDLAVHMRRHTGEKPYKCQYCNKGFTRSTEVYVHERYHTGEKKHVCNICGKAFQRPYNLVVHVRTHTGERPYQCPHCPKNFAQCSDLKAHIRRHTGERYKCDQCSMGFIHVFVLNQHKRNVHGIDVPPRIIRIAKLNSLATNPPAVVDESFSNKPDE